VALTAAPGRFAEARLTACLGQGCVSKARLYRLLRLLRLPGEAPSHNWQCSDYGLLALEPIESGREVEDAHEG
jgi:hypothetical protein